MNWIKVVKVGVQAGGAFRQFRDKDWGAALRRMPLTYKLLGAGALASLLGMFLFLAILVAVMSAAVSSVTSVVDRVPGGAWFSNGILRASGNPDLADSSRAISSEEAQELREALDEDPELMACLSEAPPVVSVPESLYIANEQEKADVIAFQDRLRQEYIDQENDRRRAAVEAGRPVSNTSRPRDPSASLPPYMGRVPANVVPEGADRGQVRDDLSPSAFIHPDLISTHQAVIPAGQQIRDGNRMADEVNLAIDSIPSGTSVGAAQTFLLVAFAGGVVNWEHFTKVVGAFGYEHIPPERSIEVAERFFTPGTDFSPYVRAVNAAVISLAADEVVEGSVGVASRAFTDCGS